jgi:hypothetical protein
MGLGTLMMTGVGRSGGGGGSGVDDVDMIGASLGDSLLAKTPMPMRLS